MAVRESVHADGEVVRFDLARTLAGRGRYWTTCYLVDGLLIDSGCPHAAGELVDALANRPLDRIVTTHSHEDHFGANGPLQRERAVEITAHPGAVPFLADPRGLQPLHPYRRLMWGWPEPSDAEPVVEGDEISTPSHRFQVLHTPGHARDHLCLYEPERGWLFTGDLYVGGRDRALRAGYDIWQILESLQRVSALKIGVLFPGAARVRADPKRALCDKIEHLEALGRRARELNEAGWSVRRIARTLCGGPMWIEVLTLGHFSRQNLVRAYLGRNKDRSRWRARV
jgi:glyoxylase-like metal-dependent hydrolase (beta-lactamase superfamily II)